MDSQLFFSRIAQHLQIEPGCLDPSRSFTSHGGHSLSAVALSHSCKRMGVVLSIQDILTAPSIEALVKHLEVHSSVPPQDIEVVSSETPQRTIKLGLTSDLMTQNSNSSSQSMSDASDSSQNENGDGSKTGIGAGTLSASASSRTLQRGDVSKSPPARTYPSTEMQLSLIRGTLENPRINIIYHRQACRAADLATLKSAWETVITHHDMFHSNFHMHNGAGFWTRRCRPFSWSEVAVQNEDEMEEELLKPPSWSGIGYAFKAIIKHHGICTLLFQVHHALIDGYSMELLLRQVKEVLSSGITPTISSNPSMLGLLRQRDAYIRQHQHEAAQFWASQKEILCKAVSGLGMGYPLRDNYHQKEEKTPAALAGSIDIKTKSSVPFLDDAHIFDLGSSLCDNIARFAREHDTTEAALYHGAWALVTSLLSDSDCVAFGTVMSGRTLPIPGALSAVGNLATALHLAVEIDQHQTTVEFLKDMVSRIAHLASFEWALPDGCYDRRFASILAIQLKQSIPDIDTDSAIAGVAGVDGAQNRAATARVAAIPTTSWSSRMNTEVPISFIVEAKSTVTIQYSSTRFHQKDIEHTAKLFHRMLTALLHPTYTVGMCLLESITLEEQGSLRERGNCHSALSTKSSVRDSLVSLFRRAVDQHPEGIAAKKVGGEQSMTMTYCELDQDSDRICQYLSRSIQPGDVVCVHADQSLAWLKALYGVLKCGAVYCPMNPSLPPTLQASHFLSSGASVYLVATIQQKSTMPAGCSHCLAVDEILSSTRTGSPADDIDINIHNNVKVEPDSGAYLCFTSGSTGKPKGVLCTHQGLVAFQRDLEVRLFARPGWRVAQIMSVSFDGSIHEIFSTLSYGASLILPETSSDPFAPLTEADAAIFTPSVAQALDPTDYPNLQAVYLVGEQVPQQVCDRWAAPRSQEKRTRLYNMYGPTEATCGATIKRLRPREKVTVGKPNSSTRIYILDRHHRLTVPGWIGQVCLAGVQVAKGYIGSIKATEERFHPDPICRELGEHMYCTGDLGYWTDSGEVVLVGRTDRQIKLRGFRVDLDDLETRLGKLPEVSAVAVARKDDYLVAMVQPRTISIEKLKASMSAVIPIHTIPRVVIAVDTFPLTKAGKLDYSKVRDGDACLTEENNKTASSSPLSDVERQVVQVWQQTLNLDDAATLIVSPDTIFSSLGGHSLHQLRLASRLSHCFSCHVPLGMVIENQRLDEQARMISTLMKQDMEKNKESLMASEPEHQPLPEPTQALSPIERWWAEQYYSEATTCTRSFNVSFACTLPLTGIDLARLEQSWNTTLARHCILSSRYAPHKHGKEKGFIRSWHSTSPKAKRQTENDTNLDMYAEIHKPFNIAHDELIRVHITNSHMLVVASHILCDLTAMRLLLDDVATLYHGHALVPLLSLPYPVEKLERRRTLVSAEKESFWMDYLRESPESLGRGPLTAPTLLSSNQSQSKGHMGTGLGTSIVMKLPAMTVDAMRGYLSRRAEHGVTNHQLAIAAVALALSSFQEHSIDITIGGPYMNRECESDLNTVGLFLEPIPIRIRSSCFSSLEKDNDKGTNNEVGIESSSFYDADACMSAVQAASKAALSHSICWDKLQEIWRHKISTSTRNMFDVMVTFHEEETGLTLPISGTETLFTWPEGSKFPLMCEFLAVRRNGVETGTPLAVVMRLEYDEQVLSRKRVVKISNDITRALWLLTTSDRSSTSSTTSQAGAGLESIREALRSSSASDLDLDFPLSSSSGFGPVSGSGSDYEFHFPPGPRPPSSSASASSPAPLSSSEPALSESLSTSATTTTTTTDSDENKVFFLARLSDL